MDNIKSGIPLHLVKLWVSYLPASEGVYLALWQETVSFTQKPPVVNHPFALPLYIALYLHFNQTFTASY